MSRDANPRGHAGLKPIGTLQLIDGEASRGSDRRIGLHHPKITVEDQQQGLDRVDESAECLFAPPQARLQ